MRTPVKKDKPPIAEWFREPSYLVLIFAGTIIAFGFLFPAFYIQLYAIEQGLDANLAFYTVAIINASSIIGRVGGNYCADKLGPINILLVAVAGTALSVWLVLAINNSASLVVVSILYGIFSGGYLSLVVTVLASLAKHPTHIGSKTGIGLAIASFALLGAPPSQGAILTSQFKWTRTTVFCGTMTVISFVFFVIGRQLVVKERHTQRV